MLHPLPSAAHLLLRTSAWLPPGTAMLGSSVSRDNRTTTACAHDTVLCQARTLSFPFSLMAAHSSEVLAVLCKPGSSHSNRPSPATSVAPRSTVALPNKTSCRERGRKTRPYKKQESGSSILGSLIFWCHLPDRGYCSCKKMEFTFPGSRSYAPKPIDWSLLLEQVTLYQNEVRDPVRGVTLGEKSSSLL